MPNDLLIPIDHLLIALGVMLIIAIAVERFMMILNWIIHRLTLMNTADGRDPGENYRTAITYAIRANTEDKYLRLSKKDFSGETFSHREIEPGPAAESATESEFDIKPYHSPPARAVLKEFWIHLFASLVAITGCYLANFSVWQLVTLPHRLSQGLSPETTATQPWEYILTGIIIGAGTKPVYFLMNFLINRKVILTREEAKEKTVVTPSPAEEKPGDTLPKKTGKVPEPISIEEIIGFTYNGGNRPDRIENSHHRRQPVDLIVYHHTAMHSDSPFEEVVKEFDRKGWMTGYHCVITKNGGINALTRWDRIGSHAKGNNYRSLGISLHGNFETTPGVPGANPNGELGIQFPTPAQLDAAAKIVVLWALLYGIRIDFKKSILPHNALQPTACPGNNFPHDNFHSLVKDYAARWRQNQQVKKALDRFKTTPMVSL